MLRSARRGAALCLCMLLTACGASETDTPPSGVSVSLEQWRSDVAEHRLQVAVRNDSAAPVYFADVQLVTGSLKTLPPERVDSTIRRTPRTDLEIPYGPARCARERVPEVKPAKVVAHIRVGDEPLRRVDFPVRHPDPLLAKLVRAECTGFLIRQTAEFEFADTWTRAGDEMRGTVVLTRQDGRERVVVREFGDTTHYRLRAVTDGEPAGVLEPDAAELKIPVRVWPSRCDPHAFAEAKQAFLFAARVRVGDGEEQVLTVTPRPEVQADLVAFARDACGL